MSLSRQCSRRGFVVPLAAAIGLAIALLMVGALEFVRVQREGMVLIRDHAEAQPILRSAVSMTALLLRIGRREPGWLIPDDVVGRRLMGIKAERLYLDGTPVDMQVLGRDVRLRVQDEAGLVPINALASSEIEAFLLARGVGRDMARRFSAEAYDFRDFDIERSQSGAEDSEYIRAGLRPPKNRAFNHVGELGLLLGAGVFPNHISRDLLVQFGFDRSGSFNINAASADMLIAVFGFSQSSADRLVQDRKARPLQIGDVAGYTHRVGASLQQRLLNHTSNRYRIEVVDIATGATMRRTLFAEPTTRGLPIEMMTGGRRPIDEGLGRPPGSAARPGPIDRETIDIF